jgi:hypothetical protein
MCLPKVRDGVPLGLSQSRAWSDLQTGPMSTASPRIPEESATDASSILSRGVRAVIILPHSTKVYSDF